MTWIKTSLFFVAITAFVACGSENTEEGSVTEETTEESMEAVVEDAPASEASVEATEPAAEEPVKAVISDEAKPAAKATKTEEVVAPKKSVAKTLSTQTGEEAPAAANDRPASE